MSSEPANTATLDVLALFPLPGLASLSERQVRGSACVWCGVELDNGHAVNLGPRPASFTGQVVRWFPRACRPCIPARAEEALAAHAVKCAPCQTRGGLCSAADGLRELVRS